MEDKPTGKAACMIGLGNDLRKTCKQAVEIALSMRELVDEGAPIPEERQLAMMAKSDDFVMLNAPKIYTALIKKLVTPGTRGER